MTTYSNITTGELDVDSPVTTNLMTKMRDNPIAISEGATDAPVLSTAWHPYNQTLVGDANTGEIWSQSSDGNQAQIVSADFEDGYEYMFVFEDISCSASENLQIELYLETDATYDTAITISPTLISAASGYYGICELHFPRLVTVIHGLRYMGARDSTVTGAAGFTETFNYDTTAQAILRARLSFSGGGNFDAGAVYQYRRRVFV